MTAGLPLMKSVLTPLAKSDLLPLGLLVGMPAADAAIQKKNNHGSNTAALIISNEEMEDIMKIVISLEESVLLIKGISETIKNQAKEQKERFFPMLVGALAASILRNALTGKELIKAAEDTIRAGENFNAAPSLKYKNIIRMNLYLMVFIQEIIYLK